MCTIIFVFEPEAHRPLLLAANRDEFYSRPSTIPRVFDEPVPFVAGQDLLAGGTWLGVRADGMLAAVTNWHVPTDDYADRTSRGRLVAQVLQHEDANSAKDWLLQFKRNPYRPFNLLFGAPTQLFIAYGRDSISIDSVAPGFSVLPNGPLNDPKNPKVQRAKQLYDASVGTLPMNHLLRDILKDTTTADSSSQPGSMPEALSALHVTTPDYGTRSSTHMTFAADSVIEYHHREGSSQHGEYVDMTELFANLTTTADG